MIEIHLGILEKAKFLDVMRDLTATVEAGFAVLEKKTAFGVDIRRSSGCEIVLKKERECRIRTQLGETLCFKCTCTTRSVIDQ